MRDILFETDIVAMPISVKNLNHSFPVWKGYQLSNNLILIS